MSFKSEKKPRVVALLGDDIQHRNTLATLIKHDINVVGVCITNNKSLGIPIKYIIKSARKRGWIKIISQIIARILYLIRNWQRDKKLKSRIFDDAKNKQIISQMNLPTVIDKSYSLQIEYISKLKPEILVVHTGSWVGKDVAEIESVKYVIGGHPGITPIYRGSNSAFWAIYNNDAKNIGWTCFIIDEGVDAGPVIEQGFIIPSDEETYMSLGWKGMLEIALSQVKAIKKYSTDGKIISYPHNSIPNNSEYFLPTLSEQIKYWILQKRVK